MRAAAILETVLYATDLDAAEAFYRDVLGLDVVSRLAGRQVFFRVGSQMLLVFNPAATLLPSANPAIPVPSHGAEGEGHVCFSASGQEIEAWRTALVASGVEIEADFVWPGGGRSLYFRDSAGNSVELAEPRIWGL